MSFQSTHPLRGATADGVCPATAGLSFQSTHPLRGATCSRENSERFLYFNPRTPCGVRQLDVLHGPLLPTFQSTHPLRGATHIAATASAPQVISIHAPLAGCDRPARYKLRMCAISIHAPLAGCDPDGWKPYQEEAHFNPRTPCGVRLPSSPLPDGSAEISIHAPLAGCDSGCR